MPMFPPAGAGTKGATEDLFNGAQLKDIDEMEQDRQAGRNRGKLQPWHSSCEDTNDTESIATTRGEHE